MKVNNFVVLTLLNFSYALRFSFPPFSMSFLYLLSCEEFYYFLDGSHLFGDSFFILKKNTI